MSEVWPLVGREPSLSRIRALMRGSANAVVLAGSAGLGKTRLALECLEIAKQDDSATAHVTASRAAASVPLGAFAPLLPAVHHGETGRVDTAADLLRRCAAALAERSRERRLVLLVDDAHLLDDVSATLVHQLTASGEVFVVLTVRTDEPAPDPVTALWKDALAERIELRALSAEAVEELLSSMLAGPVAGGTAARLAVRSEGNPLFLRELVMGAREDGTLQDVGGIWQLVGPLHPSGRLVELIEARLGGLEAAERDLLELMSFGEPLGPAELAELCDPALAETLERKGLLLSRSDGRRLELRLGHPLYGDVLRAGIPATRARAIARSLAEVVEATGARRREDMLRVAVWRLDGGGARPDLMLAAATTARWRYDFRLAERLARAAVEVGAGFDAALLEAQLAGLQGQSALAERKLTALASQATTDVQRALVAINRLDNQVLLFHVDDWLQLAEDAESTIADPVWRNEIAARRPALLCGTHGPRAGAEAAQPLLERAEEGRALAWAAMFGAYGLARFGRLEAALDTTSRGHAAHLALTEPLSWDPSIHVLWHCDTLGYAGRFEEAEVVAAKHYDKALQEGNIEAQAFLALHRGKMVGEHGHVETAARFGLEGAMLFRQLDRPSLTYFCLTYLTLALALGARHAEAAETLRELDALDLPPTLYVAVDLLQARAWTAVAGGDVPRARDYLEEAAKLGEEIGDLVGATAALHGLARLGYAEAALCRLATLAMQVEGELAAARAAHASALVDRDPERLQQVSAVFEAMGADLLAAEAAADTGVAWRRMGYPRKAAAAELQAASLASRCKGATTPALLAVEGRARLTRAEREIALLAAAGRSNKEIAQGLCLSVRTVQNHLQHVYEKLGVCARDEVEAALKLAHEA